MTFSEFKQKVQASKEEKIKHSSHMYRWQRWLSVRISWLLIKVFPRIRANHVSIFNILLILFVLVLCFWAWDSGPFYMAFIQLLLLNLTSVLDKVDGEIARYREEFTQQGVYYDITYHFFYPFVFYFVVGYFWFLSTIEIPILLIATFLAILATNSKMLGKLRHHVKYKIQLESHGSVVGGLAEKFKENKRKAVLLRLIDYVVFFIYDWTWTFYFIVIIWSLFDFRSAISIYFIHSILSIILIIKQILFDQPSRGLYSKEDFN